MDTIIGSVGVGLILLAYFLNLNNKINQNDYSYLVMNCVGAFLACISSILIESIPFTVLEGTWSVISLIAIIKKLNQNGWRKKLIGTSEKYDS